MRYLAAVGASRRFGSGLEGLAGAHKKLDFDQEESPGERAFLRRKTERETGHERAFSQLVLRVIKRSAQNSLGTKEGGGANNDVRGRRGKLSRYQIGLAANPFRTTLIHGEPARGLNFSSAVRVSDIDIQKGEKRDIPPQQTGERSRASIVPGNFTERLRFIAEPRPMEEGRFS